MIAGLDFGTSNSAIGIGSLTHAQLLKLEDEQCFLPSTLYTYDRNFVCEYIYKNIPSTQKEHYAEQRVLQLNQSSIQRQAEGFGPSEATVFFGKNAFEHYVESPEDGTFIKSPKSFLGAAGLSAKQIHFFEDLVTAKMLNLKRLAEQQLASPLTQVVIGKPVNFQGINSNESNRQAIEIITRAANRCGYLDVEFLYEPLAAGIDFETNLKKDSLVLVVDVGGGTTDCSLVKMGPSYINKEDRSSDFVAHSGRRIGGNDLDIALTFHQLMPLFGLETMQKNNLPIPSAPYWSAAAINHVAEQTRFYSCQSRDNLKRLLREARQPDLIKRFIDLQQNKLNHRLVRSAEEAKINLSNNNLHCTELDYIESGLSHSISQAQFQKAVNKQLKNIQDLINECLKQANQAPEYVYITGGSVKSPQVRKAVEAILPNSKLMDGDYFGSVAAGLTKWANKIWR